VTSSRSGLRRWILAILAVSTLSGCASVGRGGAGGAAQDGTGSQWLELELDYPPGQPVMVPVPAPNVEHDIEQAVPEIESRRNTGALTRERRGRTSPRPDLDHDVTQGIQARGAERGSRPLRGQYLSAYSSSAASEVPDGCRFLAKAAHATATDWPRS
jgi:hypothetical protein